MALGRAVAVTEGSEVGVIVRVGEGGDAGGRVDGAAVAGNAAGVVQPDKTNAKNSRQETRTVFTSIFPIWPG